MAGLIDKIRKQSGASLWGSEEKEDRRGHLRVRDAVGLVVRPLKSLPAAGDSEYRSETSLGVAMPEARTKVRKNNKYEIKGYAEVKSQYPDVTDYISALEERIRTLLLQGDRPSENPTHITSLSVGGIAFAEDMLLQVDEPVSMQITLFPTLHRISCDATIVTVSDAPEVGLGDKHTYRASFTRMSDQDRTFLEAHVKKLHGGSHRPEYFDD